MNKVTKLYQDLCDSVHELGWKIKHNFIKDYEGEVRPSKRTITICPNRKNTLYGCYILAHELGHANDFEKGKYNIFFATELPLSPYNPVFKKRFIRDVKLAERSAWKFGKQKLENRGFDISKKWYLNKEIFEKEILPNSIEGYLNKPYWNYNAKKK